MASAAQKLPDCSNRRLLVYARIDKTAWGTLIIEAEKRGRFTEQDKMRAITMWPLDDDFTAAVVSDDITTATALIIKIENDLTANWQSHTGRKL
ncbi:hypothetical protein FKG94_03240 [Exilibacterium tricleocarpae]|uniref:Uncharacterized protein n=1 Tax=Exilibacterium tricleocarpae TaxID=2591008 RepID=A0A545U6W7_9GAMM|nr:hypothetical protein [Exilibacterium tricleocarpae]TQV85218.1 hypothetical protein FKG94_03240 [Exilibacterium tricleocarpae]